MLKDAYKQPDKKVQKWYLGEAHMQEFLYSILKLSLPSITGASLVAQRLNHMPAMRETWVRFLGREDPLEKKMATHSSIPAWRIPWMEEPGGLH